MNILSPGHSAVHKAHTRRRPNRQRVLVIWIPALTVLSAAGMPVAACPSIDPDGRASAISVELAAERPGRVSGQPFVLGFNLEWKTFQTDLFDGARNRVDPKAVEYLSRLPGSVYRFPGGTVSNYLDLNRSAGGREGRPAQKSVSWEGAVPMTFGVDEYYQFLTAVNGRPWIVANVFGSFEGAKPTETLKPGWKTLAERLGGERQPLRWELGNELYLDVYKLTPEDYARRAVDAAATISAVSPGAKFVVGLSDFKTSRYKKEDFNAAVVKDLGKLDVAFAQHSYYDGPPGGPPVPNRLKEVCRTYTQLKDAGVAAPVIWITEHARWPGGKTSDRDWKSLWGKSNNLEAAIGVADYLLGLTQLPSVQGALLHSLAGTRGPWSLFMPGASGDLVPSATFGALEVLAPLSRLELYPTRVTSTNRSKYPGGYDSRAVIARDGSNGKWTLFAINRSDSVAHMQVKVPALARQQVSANRRTLAATSLEANNSAAQPAAVVPSTKSVPASFDGSGIASIELPAFSINAITF
jgi:alpha-L-arabinofuranosidase